MYFLITKKKLLAIGFSLVFATPSFAATTLIPQSILKNYHQAKNLVKKTAAFNDEYIDFSGHWIGSCDIDPDEKAELNIKLGSDFSSIKIDNVDYPIDAISTQGSHGNDQQENHVTHLRWSPDGQELLATFVSYLSESNLSQGGLSSIVGNAQILIKNEQLISNYELTFFTDGVLGNTVKIHCTYENQNKK